jgi:mannose-6-phosphate isomerase-like protein (cupin superfamily)
VNLLHLVQLGDIPWQTHPSLAGVQTKVFENRVSHPLADTLLAQVMPGGNIPWHVHAAADETAYILQGSGVLRYTPDADHLETPLEASLTAGCALTIQADVWHSILNTGNEPLILFAFHVPPTI